MDCVCVSSCDHVACDHSHLVMWTEVFVFGQALHVPKQPTLKRNKESRTKRQRVYVDILSGGTYSAIFKRTLHAENRCKHVDALERH